MPLYPPATGGGGTPGGSNTQVQFNDSGAFGGDAGLTYDKTMETVTLGTAANGVGGLVAGNGTSSNLDGVSLSVQPGMPFDNGSSLANGGAGNFNGSDGVNGGRGTGYSFHAGSSDTGSGGGVQFRSGNTGGTNGTGGITFELGVDSNGTPGELSFINVAKVDPQDTDAGVYNDNGVMTFSGYPGAFNMDASERQAGVSPGTAAIAPPVFGMAGTNGTSTTVGSTSTSATTRQIRTNWATAASAGSSNGWFCTTRNIYISSVAGVGGCWLSAVGAIGTNTTGHQAFMGLSSTGALLTGDPSAMTNFIGVGYDAADLSTGNWWIMFNDGSGTATRVDTGIARAVDGGIKLNLNNLIGTLTWNYTVTPINGGSPFTGQATTDTPVTATEVGFVISCRTGALTSAHNIRLLNQYQKWWIN